MRTFLATYKFEILNGGRTDLESSLKKLLTSSHTSKDPEVCLKIGENSLDTSTVSGIMLVNGIAKYGHYGLESDVMNLKSSQITKHIVPDETVLGDYFYIFYFKSDSNGYLVLERRGIVGIRTALENAVNEKFEENQQLQIEPLVFGINEILKNPVKSIEIKAPHLPKEIDALLEKKLGIKNEDDVTYKIVVTATKRNDILAKIIDKIKLELKNNRQANIGTIINELEEISIQVRVGRSLRTINISGGKFRSWVYVEKESNRKKEALKIIEDIKAEFGES